MHVAANLEVRRTLTEVFPLASPLPSFSGKIGFASTRERRDNIRHAARGRLILHPIPLSSILCWLLFSHIPHLNSSKHNTRTHQNTLLAQCSQHTTPPLLDPPLPIQSGSKRNLTWDQIWQQGKCDRKRTRSSRRIAPSRPGESNVKRNTTCTDDRLAEGIDATKYLLGDLINQNKESMPFRYPNLLKPIDNGGSSACKSSQAILRALALINQHRGPCLRAH